MKIRKSFSAQVFEAGCKKPATAEDYEADTYPCMLCGEETDIEEFVYYDSLCKTCAILEGTDPDEYPDSLPYCNEY